MSPTDPTSPDRLEGVARSVDSLFDALPPSEGADAGPDSPHRAGPDDDDPDGVALDDDAPDDVALDDDAPPAEGERETALLDLVEAWMEQPGEPGREAALLEGFRAAREENAGGLLARASAVLLTRGGTRGRTLAEKVLTPGVEAQLAAHLGSLRDEEERAALQTALAGLERMAEAFADALSDARDRFARRVYTDAIVEMGEAGREVALAMLDDSRWFVVRNGVSILGDLGGDDLVQHLTQTLAHDDARVRREAVRALAKIGGEDAGDLAVGMLGDPDADVRASAALAVGVLRVERGVRPLLERLDQEGDEDALVSVIRALGRLGDPGAVPALERRATGGLFAREPSAVRAAAFRALADIGTPHARRLLEDGANDRDLEVREAAQSALSTLKA